MQTLNIQSLQNILGNSNLPHSIQGGGTEQTARASTFSSNIAGLHVEDKVQAPSTEEIEQTAKLLKQALLSPRQSGAVSKAYESVMKLLEKSANPMDTMKMILSSKDFAELNIDKSPELKEAFQQFMDAIDMKEEDILKELQFQMEHDNGFKGKFFIKLKDYLRQFPNSPIKNELARVLRSYDTFINQFSVTTALEAVLREKIASIINDNRNIFDYIDFSKFFPNSEDLEQKTNELTAKIRTILYQALEKMMDSILESTIEVDVTQKPQNPNEIPSQIPKTAEPQAPSDTKPQLPEGKAFEEALRRFLSSAPASADKLENAVYQALLASLEENSASSVPLQKLLQAIDLSGMEPQQTGQPGKEGGTVQEGKPAPPASNVELPGTSAQAQAAKKIEELLQMLAKQAAELPASPASPERKAFFSRLEQLFFPEKAAPPQTGKAETQETPQKAPAESVASAQTGRTEAQETPQKALAAEYKALPPQIKQALFSQLESLVNEEWKGLVYQMAHKEQATHASQPLPSAAQDTVPEGAEGTERPQAAAEILASQKGTEADAPEAKTAPAMQLFTEEPTDSPAMRRLAALLEQGQSTLRLSLMKNELLPKLAQLKTPETEQDITLFTQNLVRAYDGLPQNFLKSVESLFTYLRQIQGLEEEELLPLRFSLLETLRDAATEKSGLTDALTNFLKAGAKESDSEAGKSVFQNLLRSLVLKNSAGLPADHFFLPIHYGNVYLLSELWKTQKKEICMEEDEDGNKVEAPRSIYKLFLAFDIENLGYFETSIFYDEQAFSIELSLPDSMQDKHGNITDSIRGIIERNHMTVSSMYFRSSNPRRKPEEIMKLLQ